MNKLLLSIPTSFGLEGPVANEVRRLGYETDRVEDGRVSFYGDERAICRANIWLRTAERVQIKMGDFQAESFTELFDQVKALPWSALLPADAAFPVKGHCLSSRLASVPDCQSIIKKAVAESMKSKWKIDRFSETGAFYSIGFNIIRDRVTIYVDTSGEGLYKRGYREAATLAPLRETLAAALVAVSGWRPGFSLWDPFCGSGTIVIEAAMMAADRAPGLERRFVAEGWEIMSEGRRTLPFKKIWDEERALARAAYESKIEELTSKGSPVILAGSDLSRRCVQTARQNASKAGVSQITRFFQLNAKDMGAGQRSLAEAGVRFPARGSGRLIANPPYGERDGDLPGATETCREWAPALTGFRHWGWCFISALENFERDIGRQADRRRKLYNGRIKCQAYMYKPDAGQK